MNGVIDWFGFNIAVKYRDLASGNSFIRSTLCYICDEYAEDYKSNFG